VLTRFDPFASVEVFPQLTATELAAMGLAATIDEGETEEEDEPLYTGEFQVDVDAFMLVVADAGEAPDLQQVGVSVHNACVWVWKGGRGGGGLRILPSLSVIGGAALKAKPAYMHAWARCSAACTVFGIDVLALRPRGTSCRSG
jgi:hypothetical protein